MGRPKAVLTGEGTIPTQGEIPGFEQKKVEEIEKWARKVDAQRDMINGLEEELHNYEFRLAEAVHANEDKVDHQSDPKHGPMLVYKRGDINVVVKRGREKVNVKIGEKSQTRGAEGDDDRD